MAIKITKEQQQSSSSKQQYHRRPKNCKTLLLVLSMSAVLVITQLFNSTTLLFEFVSSNSNSNSREIISGWWFESSLPSSSSSSSSSSSASSEKTTDDDDDDDDDDNSLVWNERGCVAWPEPQQSFPDSKNENNKIGMTTNTEQQQQQQLPPTGMVVTLARRADKSGAPDTLDFLCQKIPTQQAYFLEPHGLDLLLVLDIYGVDTSMVADCLGLILLLADEEEEEEGATKTKTKTTKLKTTTRNWTNLDGSIVTTHQYKSRTGKGNVYLMPFEMPYPDYIQRNMSLLDEPMLDCPTPHDYIQGTRYYSDQFLHLAILQDYDYMIKIDLDVEFKGALPFNMLWDMKQQGAIFGHTGEFPEGLSACCQGIHPVMESFVKQHANRTATATATGQEQEFSWTQHWKGPCSAGLPEFERGWDQYYTNFVVMDRKFFQSEPVRAYGRWMNEANPGVFKYRWGDQLFFHIAMGMFLGPDFRSYVLDYTDFRCRRFTNCWFFWVGDGGGNNDTNFCQAPGAYFHHGKARNVFGKLLFSTNVTSSSSSSSSSPMRSTPFVNRYRHNCMDLPKDQ